LGDGFGSVRGQSGNNIVDCSLPPNQDKKQRTAEYANPRNPLSNSCSICLKNCHVFCGIPDGEEGHGSTIRCNSCAPNETISPLAIASQLSNKTNAKHAKRPLRIVNPNILSPKKKKNKSTTYYDPAAFNEFE
jgi:hypothetical protein